MFERLGPPVDPVEVRLDGRTLVAERGEPLAAAALAAGEAGLARSPKLHRPRGPSCLRGDCDGCLARVDGVPNVMTCLVPARSGHEITVQNVLGSRKTDLLRATDWFFPKGIDHHHLMTTVPGLSAFVTTFARQLAGVGKLPEAPGPPRPARRLHPQVLVVGAGTSGLVVATELSARGLDVLLVDEGSALGGSARFGGNGAREILDRAIARAPTLRVELGTTAVGVYRGEVLFASGEAATLARPRALVLATGAHDGVLAVPGNDLPGVFGARAICHLRSLGIVPRQGALIVGDGPWADLAEKALGARSVGRVAEADVVSIRGRTEVTGVVIRGGRKLAATVIATAVPCAPAFELAAQAGARVKATTGGFSIQIDDEGIAAEWVFAVGECTGAPFAPAELEREALAVASAVARALEGRAAAPAL